MHTLTTYMIKFLTDYNYERKHLRNTKSNDSKYDDPQDETVKELGHLLTRSCRISHYFTGIEFGKFN